MADLVTVFETFRDIARAHTAAKEWMQLHCYGVGYLSDVNTSNLEQSTFRKEFFYSEKWNENGKNPNMMLNDFPMMLMLPINVNSSVDRDGKHIGGRTYDVRFYVFDLFAYDRNNTNESDYAKRSREEVWRDTLLIGEQVLMEFNKLGKKSLPKFSLADNGRYDVMPVYDVANARLAGNVFDCKVNMVSGCPAGTFDYEKQDPGNKEKYIYSE